jgi:hypothetical protein
MEILEDMRPMTVRQVFYQATVRGLVQKEESGYDKVQTDLTKLRRAGEIPTSGSQTTLVGKASRRRGGIHQ